MHALCLHGQGKVSQMLANARHGVRLVALSMGSAPGPAIHGRRESHATHCRQMGSFSSRAKVCYAERFFAEAL